MRLLSLTVRNYRVHRELTVSFDAGRNLIGGPNESGKSTLAEAAHRALFLKAKTGGSVQKEMVSTRHLGDPEVRLEFEAQDAVWVLEKRFAAARGSTRLTGPGGATLRDDEADVRLAELLKTDSVGGRGANQLSSLWAHLWVWQGSAVEDPALVTSSHRNALVRHLQQSTTTTPLFQSANDQRVAGKIAGIYAELFTSEKGKLKAGSPPLLAATQLQEAEAALLAAQEAAGRLSRAAEDHARAGKEIAEIEASLPGLKKSLSDAEAQLIQVQALRREEEDAARTEKDASTLVKELEAHEAKIHDIKAAIAAAITAIQPSDTKSTVLGAAESQAKEAAKLADASLHTAQAALHLARLKHDAATAWVEAQEKTSIYQRLSARVNEAEALAKQINTTSSELAQIPSVRPAELTRLRQLEAEAGQAAAALEAIATGIELIASDQPVLLNGQALNHGEQHIVTETGELTIGDGVKLRIHPGGGTSLSSTRQKAQEAAGKVASALRILGVDSVAHAAGILEKRQSLDQALSGLKVRWDALGGEKLVAELAQASTEKEGALAALARREEAFRVAGGSPEPRSAEDSATAQNVRSQAKEALQTAEAAEAAARSQSGLRREQADSASAAAQKHRDESAAARQQLRDLEGALKTREETHGDESARTQALADAKMKQDQSNQRLVAIRSSLASLRPDLLSADRERYQRAISAQENRRREAENLQLISRDRLTLDGSTDPEAELRLSEARCETACERHRTESQRAKAIETLHQLFVSSRSAIEQSLTEPLIQRISGYLECLFGPGSTANLKLSEQGMSELELSRPGDTAFSFETLSGGAREQVSAAVRLAVAEILAADHGGSLPVIFDDAFAYSDPERIQSLQRMLDLATRRGLQIIVLTCTPADYMALGAKELRLS